MHILHVHGCCTGAPREARPATHYAYAQSSYYVIQYNYIIRNLLYLILYVIYYIKKQCDLLYNQIIK